MSLSFIVGFRDREPGRVKKSLDSLQQQSCQDFQMIFVDYGSTKKNSLQIQELLTNYPFCDYYYSDTRGRLWNRGSALNTGARLATTKYIFFTDVDIVYAHDFVAGAKRQMKDDIFLVSDTARVPQDFTDWGNLTQGKYKNTFKSMNGRGIACYPREAFEKICGFDEQYAYWSNEDYDIAQRMTRFGIREILSAKLGTYHQWHPQASVNNIPYSLLFHNVSHYYHNADENPIYRNKKNNWGKLITYDERLIYQCVDPETGVLKNSEAMLFRDAYDLGGVHRWARELGEHENVVWAVSRNRENGKFVPLLNRFLHHIHWKIDRSVTYLDDFAQGMVFSVPGLIKDYYLDCNLIPKGQYSVFMV